MLHKMYHILHNIINIDVYARKYGLFISQREINGRDCVQVTPNCKPGWFRKRNKFQKISAHNSDGNDGKNQLELIKNFKTNTRWSGSIQTVRHVYEECEDLYEGAVI